MNTENKKFEEAVGFMVEWWIEKTFETELNWDNGDKTGSHVGLKLNMLANVVGSEMRKEVEKEQIEKFRVKLSELCKQEKKEFEKSGRKKEVELSVDYDPCFKLREAAKFAEISGGFIFPCKTYSYIDKNNNVYAKYKYGAQIQKVY
jgi:hypothetical protein